MKKNDVLKNDLNLQPARDSKGKRIENALVRLPQPKDNSKFPSQLAQFTTPKTDADYEDFGITYPPALLWLNSAVPPRSVLTCLTKDTKTSHRRAAGSQVSAQGWQAHNAKENPRLFRVCL